MTLEDVKDRIRRIYLDHMDPRDFYADQADDDGLLAVYRAGYNAGVNSIEHTIEPDITMEEIDMRLEMLNSCDVSLNASILGAGEIYRNPENENEQKVAWGIMYMAQVYAHGILNEKKALEQMKKEIHND